MTKTNLRCLLASRSISWSFKIRDFPTLFRLRDGNQCTCWPRAHAYCGDATCAWAPRPSPLAPPSRRSWRLCNCLTIYHIYLEGFTGWICAAAERADRRWVTQTSPAQTSVSCARNYALFRRCMTACCNFKSQLVKLRLPLLAQRNVVTCCRTLRTRRNHGHNLSFVGKCVLLFFNNTEHVVKNRTFCY